MLAMYYVKSTEYMAGANTGEGQNFAMSQAQLNLAMMKLTQEWSYEYVAEQVHNDFVLSDTLCLMPPYPRACETPYNVHIAHNVSEIANIASHLRPSSRQLGSI